jgi:hypothetical protein
MRGTMDGDWTSNSSSRSTCLLRLSGNSGSCPIEFRRPSPILRRIARLCLWSISMRLGITHSSRMSPFSVSRCWYGSRDRRLWLSARALVLNSGSNKRPLAIPRHAPLLLTASDDLVLYGILRVQGKIVPEQMFRKRRAGSGHATVTHRAQHRAFALQHALGGVDTKDSLLGANQIQGCF